MPTGDSYNEPGNLDINTELLGFNSGETINPTVKQILQAATSGGRTVTADTELAATDAGGFVEVDSATAKTITLPELSGMKRWSCLSIVQIGEGTVTLEAGEGATVNGILETAGPNTALFVYKRSTGYYLSLGGGEASSGGGGDVTAPTVSSATATGANTIVVVFSEAVTGTVAGWSFNNGGALTVASRSGSGTNTWTFTITEDMESGDTITRTYNSGTGDAEDGSGNVLASFTGSSVTNSITDDAAVFLAAAGISDPTIESAIEDLVADLKAASIWTKFKAIYPLVGTTSGNHEVNLKNPGTFDLVFGPGTHGATGWTPNGTSSYADTVLIPDQEFSNTNIHISYYSRTNSTSGTQVPIGTSTSPGGFVQLNLTSPAALIGTATSVATWTVTSTQRLFVATRSALNDLKVYRDGTQIASDTTTDTNSLSTHSITLGSRHDFSGGVEAQSFFASHECAFASIGDPLTGAEVTALNTAVNAFQTALSRNV